MKPTILLPIVALAFSMPLFAQSNDDGLPPGFAAKAEELTLPTEAPEPSLQPVQAEPEQFPIDQIRQAADALPAGKYVGKLPEDLYLKLAEGSEAEHALKLIQRWEKDGQPADLNFSGKLTYTLDSGTPLIVVKPSELTDIELQEGERINDIMLGDSIRWMVSPTVNGHRDRISQTSHVIVKAKEPNLTTSMIISTNRRSYRLRLVSSAIFHTGGIAFVYPQDAAYLAKKAYDAEMAAIEANKQQLQTEIQEAEKTRIADLERIIAEKDRQLEDKQFQAKRLANPLSLDFFYRVKRVKGRPEWQPSQVYNDGQKTYIVMPKAMQTSEAPILLIQGNKTREMVNYRVVDNKFVVDRLFQEAVMVSGVGWGRDEVSIQRTSH